MAVSGFAIRSDTSPICTPSAWAAGRLLATGACEMSCGSGDQAVEVLGALPDCHHKVPEAAPPTSGRCAARSPTPDGTTRSHRRGCCRS